jgi:hypothetical protein
VRPKIRVYLPDARDPQYMLACCNDPTPATEHRVFSGDTTHQDLYCANCGVTWMEFASRTKVVEAVERRET